MIAKYNIAPHVYCSRQISETFETQLKFGTLSNLNNEVFNFKYTYIIYIYLYEISFFQIFRANFKQYNNT